MIPTDSPLPDHTPPIPVVSRRDMLSRCGMGFGMVGLAGLLADEGRLSAQDATNVDPLIAKPGHFRGRAKHVVHLFMNGGPSQVDTFDPKPMLDQYHGKPLPTSSLRTERKTGAAMRSPFSFQKYGQSGIEVSELFSKTAAHIDDIAVIRSLHAEVPNHEPSLMLMNCGDGRLSRPSFGAWVNYGLGTENRNLPGFIVMCPGGYPIVATQNWRSSFLPGACQGTYLDTNHTDIDKLIANISNSRLSLTEQRRQLDLVKQLNVIHAEERQHSPLLEARIQSLSLIHI